MFDVDTKDRNVIYKWILIILEVVCLSILIFLLYVAKKSFNIFSKAEFDWIKNADINNYNRVNLSDQN
jgi:hypothetical protein